MLVVVLGDSLLMDGVGTSMRNGNEVCVVRLDPFRKDLDERIQTLQPDMIVFEMDTPRPCALLSMLKNLSGTLFLGIDANYNQVTVLNSNRHAIQNMKEFCQLVHIQISEQTRMHEGGYDRER